MEQTQLNGLRTGSSSGSLFATESCSPDSYCESYSRSQSSVRQHWQAILSDLEGAGREALSVHQQRAETMRHEDGATINPFDEPSQRATSWALDIIPFPISEKEWATLEGGVFQRAMLLERILSDIYGSQDLIKDGSIPAELIFANPHYLHSCHSIIPAGNRFLSFYAVDLYRDGDGRFRVFRDYGSNPAGLGFALENRIVMSRVFSELYHKTQIRRLAPFFQSFQRALVERSALSEDSPGIVLLSPGPDSHVYFEHALLSRYLGYPLVEGQDLTVRNGKVFLKKLAGLEPVEALFRHIPDLLSDPFALRRKTSSGVAGLIQAARERNIDIVSPIGSGFIETPVLQTFLPSLCRKLNGVELHLQNHPALWCGHSEGFNRAMNQGTQWILSKAMEHAPVEKTGAELTAAIVNSAYQYMIAAPLAPSTSAAWKKEGADRSYTLLRIFACATADGFSVMPGGLAITAGDVASLEGSNPERQQSKDIWVFSEKPVEPVTLLEGFHAVPEFKRSSDLPSRVADNLLWLGRYLERAEGLTRLLRSVFRRLSGEDRLEDIPELEFLIKILQEKNIIPALPERTIQPQKYSDLHQHLENAIFQYDQSVSVGFVLRRVQETARNVRDRLSIDSFRVLNRLEDFSNNRQKDPLEILDRVLFFLSAFSGLAMESMTRGLGWRFMDLGRRVERAINQTTLLRTSLPLACIDSRSSLQYLLEVSDSLMTYRARYKSAFQLAPVLDLLMADETNPKSLAFQFSQLVNHVKHLPSQSERRFASGEERIALEMLTTVRLLDLTGIQCGAMLSEHQPLENFLSSIEDLLKEFALQVTGHYLSRVPSTPHYTVIPGNQTE
jgi:uncharacterized circularly permuted ATP-grasp superfamily protein/uncharacterized alpha-E superfamily protein